MPDDGDLARERIAMNGVEQAEWRYLKAVGEFGKEAVVIGFNLLDPMSRNLAEGIAGQAEIQRTIDYFDPAEVTPVFLLVLNVANALGWIESLEPDYHRDLCSRPWPDDKFLFVAVSHQDMLLRFLPKPR
jgi:hypothetical protein